MSERKIPVEIDPVPARDACLGWCSACTGRIEVGALRCRHCGAAFQGRDPVPTIGIQLDGAGMRFVDPWEIEREAELAEDDEQ